MVNGNTNINATAITATNSIYGGGNAAIVGKNTYLLVSNCIVQNSVYAGGNGTTAIVKGNTNLDIDNGSDITNHVFGGGNAAATGIKEVDNSTGIVNIAGATIGKNVYGGANTSVLYGVTTVNIGQNVITNNSLIPTDISIGGTVFGGGEANASGSENYDFTFISVTKGININIDAKIIIFSLLMVQYLAVVMHHPLKDIVTLIFQIMELLQILREMFLFKEHQLLLLIIHIYLYLEQQIELMNIQMYYLP